MEDALKRIIADYVDSLSYVKSIDGFLIKTTTLVYMIEDLCRNARCDPGEVLERVLGSPEVRRYLSIYSCYRDNIVGLISTDPRHKKLRKYVEVLGKALSSAECRGDMYHMEVSVETPPAVWAKEKASIPVIYEERPRRRLLRRPRDPEGIIIGIWTISIILFILYIILGFFQG